MNNISTANQPAVSADLMNDSVAFADMKAFIRKLEINDDPERPGPLRYYTTDTEIFEDWKAINRLMDVMKNQVRKVNMFQFIKKLVISGIDFDSL